MNKKLFKSFLLKEFTDILSNEVGDANYKRTMPNLANATYNGTSLLQSYDNVWFPRIKRDIISLLKSQHSKANAEEAYLGYIQSQDMFIVAFDTITSGNTPDGNEYNAMGYVSCVFAVVNGMYQLDNVYNGFDSFYLPKNSGEYSYEFITKNRDKLKIVDLRLN